MNKHFKLWTTQQNYEAFVQSGNYEEPYVHILSDKCDYNQIIATDTSNLPLMDIARSAGWVASTATYMTKIDAARITTEQFNSANIGVKDENATNAWDVTFKDLETFTEFQYFTGVTEVYVTQNEENTERIGGFFNCTKLTDIILPTSITRIGHRAFQWCGFDYIHLHEGITGICNLEGEMSAFYKSELVSITLPNSLLEIGQYGFGYCENLKKVTLGNSIETIGEGAFYSCPNLTCINFPNSLKTIGEQAFWLDESIVGIKFGNSLTTIGGNSFVGCKNIEHLLIPKSVTSIGYKAFGGYVTPASSWNSPPGIKCVEFEEGNNIKIGAIFQQNLGLEKVILSRGVTELGQAVFYDSTKLKEVNCQYVTSLPKAYTFRNCRTLTFIDLSSIQGTCNLDIINCINLKKVTIGENVTSLKVMCQNNNIQQFIVMAITPPTLSLSGSNIKNFYIPDEYLETYKTASSWSAYASKIKGISELETTNNVNNLVSLNTSLLQGLNINSIQNIQELNLINNSEINEEILEEYNIED